MTYDEALVWSKYMGKRGSLHTGMQLDMTFARALSFFASAMGVKKKNGKRFAPADFLALVEVEQPELTIDEVLQGLGKR